jgi:hypothetical protein
MLFSVIGDAVTQDVYPLQYLFNGKDTTTSLQSLDLQKSFKNAEQCKEYINNLQTVLQSKGYLTTSVDSVVYDSLEARVWVFLGETYRWAELSLPAGEQKKLVAAGWNFFPQPGKMVDFSKMEQSGKGC